MEKTRSEAGAMPPPEYAFEKAAAFEYTDEDWTKEVSPIYREELEFNKEIGGFRDQAARDETFLLEFNGPTGSDEEEEKLELTDSDLVSPTDEEMLAEALRFAKRQPKTLKFSEGLAPKLEKPVVVPQVRDGVGVPFARAYCEALASYDVADEEWLAFIDNLNVVATANPPLQVLDMVGNAIGFM
jgi:hypothetical protein